MTEPRDASLSAKRYTEGTGPDGPTVWPGQVQEAAQAAREAIFASIEAGVLDDVNRAALTKVYEAGRAQAAAEVAALREALEDAIDFTDRVGMFARLVRGNEAVEQPRPMEQAAAVLATTLRAALAAKEPA